MDPKSVEIDPLEAIQHALYSSSATIDYPCIHRGQI